MQWMSDTKGIKCDFYVVNIEHSENLSWYSYYKPKQHWITKIVFQSGKIVLSFGYSIYFS